MVLDSRIQRVRDFYGLHTLEDWGRVTPADVLFVEQVGEATLNHIRLYLAGRGRTLQDDRTPEFWNEHLGTVKVVQSITDDDKQDVCPFTIIVDVNESIPYTFESFGQIVNTERLPLYRYGLADYTIRGMEQDIQIERKGDDLSSSLSSRRDEFEQEIYRLDQTCEFAAVVVEHEWSEILSDEHDHGARAKSICRTVQSWQMKYPRVHWCFLPGRAPAEAYTFRLLSKFWQLKSEQLAIDKQIASERKMAELFSI